LLLPESCCLLWHPPAVAALEKSAKAALKQVITPENAGNLLRMAFHDAGEFVCELVNHSRRVAGSSGYRDHVTFSVMYACGRYE
jgi:hypothetical protein